MFMYGLTFEFRFNTLLRKDGISEWKISSAIKMRKNKKILSAINTSKVINSSKIVSQKWKQIETNMMREKPNLAQANVTKCPPYTLEH